MGAIGAIGAIGWAVKVQPWQEPRDIGVLGRVGEWHSPTYYPL